MSTTRAEGRLAPWVAAVEAGLAVAVILLDLLIPSLVLLLLAGSSLAVHRQRVGTLGVRRSRRRHLVRGTLAVAVVWSLFQLAVTLPLASHLSGTRQDVGVFARVEGDLGLLVVLLVLSWTLGAVVEELAFRGYLLTRLEQVAAGRRFGTVFAVVVSSLLFGILHSEQGVVGVVAVALDGVVFCAVRHHYDTVWAAVLVHGFNNTLGLVTFFAVGPVYGLW